MPAKAKPKPKRAYNATRRQAQAAEARRQMVAAAGRLFGERGYTGTTMEAVAQAAGVAVETVYAAFGSKRALLARLVDVAVGGDDAPIPLLERPGPEAVRQEPDQVRQIQLLAEQMNAIMSRVGPLFEILRAAAKTEAEIAELLQRLLAERRQGLGQFVRYLAANGPLRAGLSAAEAADTVWTLTSPEVYRLLTQDRGWSGEAYTTWLAQTLQTLLLPAR